jgi:2-polyprenyl-6-methoxyphenol hydroxylase-like FAD-dependent oxidoreductase
VEDTDVLIAGAGPTGLVLALWLVRQGVRVRVVDQLPIPGTTSRAIGVVPRTLELYRQLGLADTIVKRGHVLGAINLWVGAERVAHARLGEMGEGISPYPFLLMFPQDEHERLLIERLEAEGVRVERPSALASFETRSDQVIAQLRDSSGHTQQCRAAFLAGCDGARSTVRRALQIEFAGGTYSHLFYVADVDASGPLANGELHIALDETDFLGMFPLAKKGRARLIGTVRQDAVARAEMLTWADVSSSALARLHVDVERVNWFSTYHVHHRVASRFRAGRVFLLGDAAHVHSPVGAQGMNTGIGDAINLAWKLAAVVQQRAPLGLLDSYEEERSAFAHRLVKTTDRAFQFATSESPLVKAARLKLAPHVLSALLERAQTRRWAFRTVSQTRIQYRSSPLSQGAAGRVHAGDRLPWLAAEGAGLDNFQPLGSLDWQVHVYGEAPGPLRAQAEALGLPLHVFAWQPAAEHAGFERNAMYLLRPDGYIAYADSEADAARLTAYLDSRAIRLR